MKNIPVYLVYYLFPVVFVADYNLKTNLSRNVLDLIWVVLFVFLIPVVFLKLIKTLKLTDNVIYFALFVFLVSGFYFVKYMLFGVDVYSFELLTFAIEIKVFFYILFSVLWVYVYGSLKLETFITAGVFLSVVVIASVIIESILSHEFVRGHGSGEINYDASLLLLSLVVAIFNEHKTKNIFYFIITFGLVLTLPRTSLIVMALIVFLYTNFKVYNKVILIFVAMSLVLASFVVRDLDVDLIKVDRFTMWASVYESFSNDLNIMGTLPGFAINVKTPESLQWLWSKQSEEHGLIGVYPFHLHAMWLRFYFTFGLLITMCIFFYFWINSFYAKNKLRKSISFIIIMQGFTMGVFYLSMFSIPLIILFLSSKSKKTDNNITVNNKHLSNCA